MRACHHEARCARWALPAPRRTRVVVPQLAAARGALEHQLQLGVRGVGQLAGGDLKGALPSRGVVAGARQLDVNPEGGGWEAGRGLAAAGMRMQAGGQCARGQRE